MELWIGVYLPQLPIEVFEPAWSPNQISVVLEHDRVLALSVGAQRAGIRKAMRRGGVLMLEPEARVHERSGEREADALQSVALALLQYTPLVTIAEESVIICEIGRSINLFHGLLAIRRRIRADLRNLGFTGLTAYAPTARGAWMLARSGGRSSIRHATMERCLNDLPVQVIPEARRFATWFDGIGCQTIAELRRLPRPGLRRRCGQQLVDMLDAAFGTVPELFEWVLPAETFTAKLELFDRIENADLLLAGAQRLVLQLVGWLCGKQLAAEGITLLLEHERGRVARPPSPIEVLLAEPAWQPEHILRLLKERLGKCTLEAPVIGLVLEVTRLKPMAPVSDSLFPSPANTEKDQAKLLELLVARLGAENVLQPSPVADYRPEVANAWAPAHKKLSAAAVAGQMPPNVESMPRPTWILEKPIALLIRNHKPVYESELRMVAGPERVEAGWWNGSVARDYFVAESNTSAMYWVYRERIGGDNAEPQWFLHGLFG